MASNADGSVTLDFTIYTDDLSKQIDAANKSVEKFAKNTQKGMKATEKQIEEAIQAAKDFKIEPTAEGIEDAIRELDRLNAVIEISERQYGSYQRELERVSNKYGENSSQALRVHKNMLSLEASMDKNKKKSTEYANAISKVETVLNSGGDAAKKFEKGVNEAGEETQQAEKMIGSFQIALGNLISRGIEKAVGALLDIADATRETRKEMAMLEVNAESAGVGIEIAEQAMKELNVVADGTDSALEATSNLLASGFDENGLADAVNVLGGAVIKFPDTMKIESLADGLQETLATKEATGQYAELLERLGVDLDSYNDAIKDMTDAQARDYSVLILRNRGLEKQYLQYKANNEELVNAADAQWDYDQAMASLGEALEPIQSGIMQEITQLLSDNGDVVRAVAQNLADLAGIILNIIAVLGSIPAPVWAVIGMMTTVVGTFLTVYKTVKQVSDSFGLFGKGLSAFDTKALKTTGIIMGIIIVLVVLAAIIALVTKGSSELERSMNAVGDAVGKIQGNLQNNVNVNPNRNPYFKNYPGYAKGTQSAGKGWRLVGEQGPELLYLRGGEKILTASQSMAWNAAYGGRIPDRAFNQTINLNVNGIDQMNEVVNWYTNRQQMARAR